MKSHPKVFYNQQLRDHLNDLLFDQQRAQLPANQLLVKKIEWNNEWYNLEHLKFDIKLQLQSISHTNKLEPKQQFICGCPADGCRGFISQQWKCGICDIWVCHKCHAIKNDVKHKCNEDDVKSAKFLNKDTKPCPCCASMINKIDGCSQMFCTQCHTAFSWTTGEIEKGVMHNPHYFEWQRQTNGGVAPRVAGDNPCGGDYQIII